LQGYTQVEFYLQSAVELFYSIEWW